MIRDPFEFEQEQFTSVADDAVQSESVVMERAVSGGGRAVLAGADRDEVHRVVYAEPLLVHYIYAEYVDSGEAGAVSGEPDDPIWGGLHGQVERYVHIVPLQVLETHSRLLANALRGLRELYFIELEVPQGDMKRVRRFVSFVDQRGESYQYELMLGEPYQVDRFTYKWHAQPLGRTRLLVNRHWLVQAWNSLVERLVKRVIRAGVPIRVSQPKSSFKRTLVFLYEPQVREFQRRIGSKESVDGVVSDEADGAWVSSQSDSWSGQEEER